jgi:acyl carrier protein
MNLCSSPASHAALRSAINTVKRLNLHGSEPDPALYLGGDLGIDSIEMLEIWFHTEKTLGIRIADDAKRDIYTVAEVLAVLDQQSRQFAASGIEHV